MNTRAVPLSFLLEGMVKNLPPESSSLMATGIAYDSRRVEPGNVFISIPGEKTDGHRFASQALARGAVAIVAERPLANCRSRPVVIVRSGRQAMAKLAVRFFGDPSAELRVVGVTGTNGKTTVAILSKAVLEAAGSRVGLVGTIDYRWGERVLPASRTTPESADLQGFFREMLETGCDSAVMEVSSHALEQYRVEGVKFSAAIFTNVSRDHLDFHGTVANYVKAKAKLFGMLSADGRGRSLAIVNADDPAHGEMLAAIHAGRDVDTVRYGFSEAATVKAREMHADRAGTRFVLVGPGVEVPVKLRLLGTLNVRNALAASALGLAYSVSPEKIRDALEKVEGVPGRFEVLKWGGDFVVVVDYAHTADALTFAIQTAKELKPARVITVFGCGGDRDRSKRPEMGAVSARLSDLTFLTTDNPRSERPEDIIAETISGYTGVRQSGFYVVPDRREAIRAALDEAKTGDVVLICGKGHENVQIFHDRVMPFNDRDVAMEFLRG